jgi:hypothetical protein
MACQIKCFESTTNDNAENSANAWLEKEAIEAMRHQISLGSAPQYGISILHEVIGTRDRFPMSKRAPESS